MLKIYLLFIILLNLSSVTGQTNDNSSNKKFRADTESVKVIFNNDNRSPISETVPFILGFSGILLSLFTVVWTIRHQRKITQAQITSETKRKWIAEVRKTTAKFNSIYSKLLPFLSEATRGAEIKNEDIESIKYVISHNATKRLHFRNVFISPKSKSRKTKN